MLKPISTKNEIKKGLYLVPTPIGNLGDITFRSLEILQNSDYILCEDTRISKILFKKYKIDKKLISNHKFNETQNTTKIIKLLKDGNLISLISDAGTPTISDPGAILVKECIKNDIQIIPLPGASAVTASISASGFSDRYYFYGFFPEKEKILNEDLEMLSQINSSIVFFISPRKINKIIPYIKKNFDDRMILICREISKYYEEFIRCEVKDLKKLDSKIKGEITIVISEKKINKKNFPELSESDKYIIDKMIKKFSTKEISELVSKISRVSKKEIYNYCLRIKNEK